VALIAKINKLLAEITNLGVEAAHVHEHR
jgi:hypothetical protein